VKLVPLTSFDLFANIVWQKCHFLQSCESYLYRKAKVSKNLMPLVKKYHFTRKRLFITIVLESQPIQPVSRITEDEIRFGEN
jgi:hypothetical protein